jgi:hypothetical protein
VSISIAETISAIGTLVGDTNSTCTQNLSASPAVACNGAATTQSYTFQVAIPQFNPPSNTYASSQSVTITTVTPGASLYYSVNSQPTCASTAYTVPVTVAATEILYAIGCLSGYNSGPNAAIYNIGTFTAGTPSTDDNAYCGPGDVPLFPNDSPAIGPQSCNYTKRSASPSGGATHTVNTASDFTAALATAACGDNIVITAGITIQGNFTVPSNSCTSSTWITIKSSGLANFPPEGTRATPCYFGVSSMAGRPSFNCTTTTNYGALIEGLGLNGDPLTLATGVHYLRIEGLQFSPDPANVFGTEAEPNYFIINMSNGNTDHIVFDQLWVHGNPNGETVSYLSVGYAAANTNEPTTNISWIDSTFTDAHCVSGNGQCNQSTGLNWGGNDYSIDRTFKLVNNYIESAGENFFAGGGGGSTVPTDIELRLNYSFKPLTWDKSSSTYNGGACKLAVCNPYVVENLGEAKNSERIFVEGNRFQNNWEGFSQYGEGVVFDPKGQGGENPNATVRNVIFRYNYGSTVTQTYQIPNAGSDGGDFAYAGNSYSFHDNLWDDMDDPVTCGSNTSSCYNLMAFEGPGTNNIITAGSTFLAHDMTVNHETWVQATTSFLPTTTMWITGPLGALQTNLTLTNLIMPKSQYWITYAGGTADCGYGKSTGNVTAWFNACWSPGTWTFSNNVIVGGGAVTWPTGNFTPSPISNVGFVNYNNGIGGDYRLCTGVGTPSTLCGGASTYHNYGTDGLDIGVSNWPLLTALTTFAQGAILPSVSVYLNGVAIIKGTVVITTH